MVSRLQAKQLQLKRRMYNGFKSTSVITPVKCRMYNGFKSTNEITTSVKMQNV